MSLLFEQRVFHIWEIFNVFFFITQMFTSADLPLCGVVFLPLDKSLGPPHTMSLQ